MTFQTNISLTKHQWSPSSQSSRSSQSPSWWRCCEDCIIIGSCGRALALNGASHSNFQPPPASLHNSQIMIKTITTQMDSTPWCYKWTDGIGLEGQVGWGPDETRVNHQNPHHWSCHSSRPPLPCVVLSQNSWLRLKVDFPPITVCSGLSHLVKFAFEQSETGTLGSASEPLIHHLDPAFTLSSFTSQSKSNYHLWPHNSPMLDQTKFNNRDIMHKCIQTGTANAFWLVETISAVFWLAPIQLLPVSPESSGLVGVYWVTGGRQNSLETSFSILLLLLLLLLLLQAKVHIIGQLSSKYESNQDCDSLINYGLTKHKKTDSNLSHQHCPAKLQLSSPLSNILHHHITSHQMSFEKVWEYKKHHNFLKWLT